MRLRMSESVEESLGTRLRRLQRRVVSPQSADADELLREAIEVHKAADAAGVLTTDERLQELSTRVLPFALLDFWIAELFSLRPCFVDAGGERRFCPRTRQASLRMSVQFARRFLQRAEALEFLEEQDVRAVRRLLQDDEPSETAGPCAHGHANAATVRAEKVRALRRRQETQKVLQELRLRRRRWRHSVRVGRSNEPADEEEEQEDRQDGTVVDPTLDSDDDAFAEDDEFEQERELHVAELVQAAQDAMQLLQTSLREQLMLARAAHAGASSGRRDMARPLHPSDPRAALENDDMRVRESAKAKRPIKVVRIDPPGQTHEQTHDETHGEVDIVAQVEAQMRELQEKRRPQKPSVVQTFDARIDEQVERRAHAREHVFRNANPWLMTPEQWFDVEMEMVRRRPQQQAPPEEKDEDDMTEEELERKRKEDQAWDAYKDDHEYGSGNPFR
ncbi:MAG: hypothetical protein MHM6MM_004814 [Cercozoa sp. M6MM]